MARENVEKLRKRANNARNRAQLAKKRTNQLQSLPAGSLTPLGIIDLKGNKVIPKRSYDAMFSSDFIACESAKIRAIRSLPVRLLHDGERGPENAINHPLSRVLRRPNPLMSWGDLVSWLILRKDVFGTAYIRVQRDRQYNVKALWPVLSAVDPRFDKQTGEVVYCAPLDKFNPSWAAREDGVLVVKTDISDDGGVTGKSVAETAASDIGMSIDLSLFYKSLMENGTHMGGWLEHPGKLEPKDITAIRESLESQSGVEEAGGIRIFDRGLKYHEVSYSLGEMNIIEQERFVLEKVCRACHVDLHHVYADGGATATGSQGYDIDFVKNTVLPEITAIEEAFIPILDLSTYVGGGTNSGYRVDFDTNGLLRGDFKTRMDGYRIGVYAGIFTRAWCCEQEGIPWLPGQDKLLQPTAYYMVDEDGEPYVPAEQTSGTSGQSDGVSGIDPKEAKQAQ